MNEREGTTLPRQTGTRRWFLGGAVGAAGAALAAWTGMNAGLAREQEPGDDHGGHGREPGDDHGRHHHHRHHHRRGNHR